MKQLIYKIALLLSLMFAANSCIIIDDDDWDEQSYEDFLMTGRWYPASRSGLSDCEYNSYMEFYNSGIVRWYDCGNLEYNNADFSLYRDQLYLDYDSGRESYTITRADGNELEIRNNDSGVYYSYTRQ